MNTLRRAGLTLRAWYTMCCNYYVQRDELNNKVTLTGHGWSRVIADRETGAANRIKEVCSRNGLYFFLQTDPRGASLYIDAREIPVNNYTRSFCVSV